MKKLIVLVCVSVLTLTANAQHQINSFFDSKGAVRLETQELDKVADTLVTVFHRADDVVWSRVVYRIIDMRYKQNFQLYYPTNSEDPQYKGLFQVMLEAMADTLHAYALQSENNIKPYFHDDLLLTAQDKIDQTAFGERRTLNMTKEEYEEFFGVGSYEEMMANSNKSLFSRCNPNDSNKVCFAPNPQNYKNFVRNQLKFVIQEVVIFDKHYSRLYSKIIAIAPLYAELGIEDVGDPAEETVNEALCRQLMWWVPFDEFRKYMAKQYMIPQGNDTKRVTFEEFFGKRLYSSYLIGDSNMYDRMFSNYIKTEKDVQKEQARVANELLDFEQDLWEY